MADDDKNTSSADSPIQSPTPGRLIDERFLNAARLPFLISTTAITAILTLFFLQSIYGLRFEKGVLETDSAFVRFVFPNAIYI
jgi:hypothetical protein